MSWYYQPFGCNLLTIVVKVFDRLVKNKKVKAAMGQALTFKIFWEIMCEIWNNNFPKPKTKQAKLLRYKNPHSRRSSCCFQVTRKPFQCSSLTLPSLAQPCLASGLSSVNIERYWAPWLGPQTSFPIFHLYQQCQVKPFFFTKLSLNMKHVPKTIS